MVKGFFHHAEEERLNENGVSIRPTSMKRFSIATRENGAGFRESTLLDDEWLEREEWRNA